VKWLRWPDDDEDDYEPWEEPWRARSRPVECSPDDEGAFPVDVETGESVPVYPLDLNAIYELEERLLADGRWQAYYWALAKMTAGALRGHGREGVLRRVFATVHASPRERCLAALDAAQRPEVHLADRTFWQTFEVEAGGEPDGSPVLRLKVAGREADALRGFPGEAPEDLAQAQVLYQLLAGDGNSEKARALAGWLVRQGRSPHAAAARELMERAGTAPPEECL
jgi:hypothetical protein